MGDGLALPACTITADVIRIRRQGSYEVYSGGLAVSAPARGDPEEAVFAGERGCGATVLVVLVFATNTKCELEPGASVPTTPVLVKQR